MWQCLGAANLTIYIFLLPAFTFKLMYEQRNDITDPESGGHEEAQRTFGFLINSLEVENGYYYWEREPSHQAHPSYSA